MPIFLLIGPMVAGVVAWAMARHGGLWVGLAVPALALGAVLSLTLRPVHAEAVMGAGLEMMFLWMPLVALTVLGCVLGLIARYRAGLSIWK